MIKVKRLLLVEDDPNLGFVMKDNLETSGYQVDWAKDGQEGIKFVLNRSYDLALLDVMLPHLSGFEIAEEINNGKPDLPFLFVTAKSMLEDKVRGLKLGEDYITKPFEFAELKQRIENIFNRKTPISAEGQLVFTIGSFEFDFVNQYLDQNEKRQKLTKREADVLRQLCLHMNQVMNRQEALKAIWGNDDYFNGRSMDVFISRIRKYLSEDPNIQIINVHGVGFKLAIK